MAREQLVDIAREQVHVRQRLAIGGARPDEKQKRGGAANERSRTAQRVRGERDEFDTLADETVPNRVFAK